MLQSAVPIYNEQNELACSLCQQPLHVVDAKYGHPFITTRQLVSMAIATLIRSPKLFSEVMFTELPPAPYCSECRQQLHSRRQTEQLKLLLGLLLFLIALATAIILLQVI